MSEVSLGWASLRHRPMSILSTFITLFLGAVLVTTFASMLETLLLTPVPVDDATEQTLLLIGAVTGGWALVLVVFAVTSTMGLTLRQRRSELTLLSALGATPGQLARVVVSEVLLVSAVAVAISAPFAASIGSWFVGELQSNGLVMESIQHSFGQLSITFGALVTIGGSLLAAVLSLHLTVGRQNRDVRGSSGETHHIGRIRRYVGFGFVAAGLLCGVLTAILFRGKGIDAMTTGAQACLLTAIGLATLAPMLVQPIARFFRRTKRLVGTASWHLVDLSLRDRYRTQAALLAPIIVLVGVGVGELTMQSIESIAGAGPETPISNEAAGIQRLNYITIASIVVFAAVMLVNQVVVAVGDRRVELARTRLAGATRGQVLTALGLEATALAVWGIIVGLLAAAPTAIPYGYARIDDWWLEVDALLIVGPITAAMTLTLMAALLVARSVTAGSAVRQTSLQRPIP